VTRRKSKPRRLAYAARKRRPKDKFIKDFEGFDFADSAQEINGRDQLLRQLYRMLFW
jgi:hypothetical protein